MVVRPEKRIEALGSFNDNLSHFIDWNECIHHLGQPSLKALGPLYLHHVHPPLLVPSAVLGP